ncbi:MAG: hypothetical protein KDI39_18570, partial [Pseudomonadales bacterium]|nr:hypothetical protein [Pseudomonadales bacterium]
MSEQDKSTNQKSAVKSWFSWGKEEASQIATTANQESVEAQNNEWLNDPVYFEEGSLDVTLPSLPAVDVPIIENPRTQALVDAQTTTVSEQAEPATKPAIDENSFFSRMKVGLSRTREQFSNGMVTLLIGGKEID